MVKETHNKSGKWLNGQEKLILVKKMVIGQKKVPNGKLNTYVKKMIKYHGIADMSRKWLMLKESLICQEND